MEKESSVEKVKKEFPLISVIIPVYNVERYLHQCMESVINQTYENLEIILIDDGSTDNSPQICEEYGKKDNRIKVVHKKNGGLSDARNTGMELAKGEFIAFVDSDDWIELNMYQELYELSVQYKADITLSRFKEVREERIIDDSTGKVTILKENELLQEYIKGENYCISTSVWDRLYKRELIKDLRFPVGKFYEDIVFSMIALSRVSIAVYIDNSYYNYRIMRNGSITGTELSLKKITDQICLMEEARIYLEKIEKKELSQQYGYQIYSFLMNTYVDKRNIKENAVNRYLLSNIYRYRKIAKDYYKHNPIWINSFLFKKRFLVKVMLCCPKLYFALIKIIKLKHKLKKR